MILMGSRFVTMRDILRFSLVMAASSFKKIPKSCRTIENVKCNISGLVFFPENLIHYNHSLEDELTLLIALMEIARIRQVY